MDRSNLSTPARQCAVCGEATKHCCSSCLSVFYCSEAHQLEHWNSGHHAVCASLSARRSSPSKTHANTNSRRLATPSSTVKRGTPATGNRAGAGDQLPGSRMLADTIRAISPLPQRGNGAASNVPIAELAGRDSVRAEAIEHLSKGEWKDAIKKGLNSYILSWRYYGTDHPDLITECLILVSAYVNVQRDGDATEALARYQRHARSLAQLQPYPDPLSNAQLYYILGNLYLMQSEFEEAEKMFQVYTTLIEVHFGTNHLATSDCYACLSSLYAKFGKLNVALEYSGKALLIRMDQLGMDHQRTADSHYNTGLLYRMNNNPSEALAEFGFASRIRKKIVSQNPNNQAAQLALAEVDLSLGVTHHQLGEFATALSCYERALRTRISVLGAESDAAIDIVFYLSTLYHDTGKLDKAYKEAQTCVLLRQSRHGQLHPSTADAYTRIGTIASTKGDRVDAEKYLSQAHSVYVKTLGYEHARTVYCRKALNAVQTHPSESQR